ncbi:MAG: FAD-dependent oxidoreductase [Ignavibacteriota bacterium]|nr:response regulator [Ignavibacteriota bacterium]MCC7094003.1 FAD-dependent oxidoreductase [Ignavibacteriaceae bacterium]MEB2297006.1 FAD-dependent oxidoreductase [Ignavibacteria bacterium]QKJ95349.1 MAG: FAD-dependent oxidoreductase [Ignavibacteriota bacterium]GIK59760.1 MAG: fused response regulator/thioredoxin-disulfide reductase [Ignavibacteriota bacterium]
MKLPFILIVDDDEHVLRAIQRDIRKKYQTDYRISATDSANEAIELIKELKLKNETVALIISDQRMPEMEGIIFLEKSKELYSEAKSVLLTAYSDIDVAIRSINNLKLDYYLLKPWNPPDEKLYPIVDDLLDDWQAQYKPDHEGIRIIGFQWSPKSHQLKEFLSGNLIPYRWMDVENDSEAEKYLVSANLNLDDLPLIILKDGTWIKDPSLTDLAQKIGLQQTASLKMYDVLIIGGGPAGLAASVYGSCEGLKTILVEKSNPGGQASSSARIENYLGFPKGLSGADLTRRAISQTLRFGTEILTPKIVRNIRVHDGYKITEMTDGTEVHSKAVIVATGVEYTKLEITGIEKFTGAGVYYGSASVEAHACRDEIIYIVGGGNSACQAAMHICKFAKEVNIIIRRDSIKKTAANYLIENIAKTSNIKIHTSTEVISVDGDKVLEKITFRDSNTGEEKSVPAKALFIYIGAKPGTSWLNSTILKDAKGFIITGSDLMKEKSYNTFWKLERNPFLPETNIPGIFACGDVRSTAFTGISSAVGEGAMAIRFVRKYLDQM